MHPSIIVKDLSREYHILKRYPGLRGSLRSLFSKEYQVVPAVDGISFSIDQAEIVGYIGQNGAGKSTTFKLLTGVLIPTKGEIKTDGFDPSKQRQQLAHHIGTIFGHRSQLWWDLPLKDSLEILQAIYQIPQDVYEQNLDDFKQVLKLESLLNVPVRQLSLGQRMRGELAAAFLHNPHIAFLDEPFLGLDLMTKEYALQFISERNQKYGITIFLASHDMSDVERLCHRVLILDQGKLIYNGKVEDIRQKYTKYRTLIVHTAETYADVWSDYAELIQASGNRIVFHFARTMNPNDLIHDLSERYVIKDLAIEESSLQDIIRELYEQKSSVDKVGADKS